jgi:hypothetical protein
MPRSTRVMPRPVPSADEVRSRRRAAQTTRSAGMARSARMGSAGMTCSLAIVAAALATAAGIAIGCSTANIASLDGQVGHSSNGRLAASGAATPAPPPLDAGGARGVGASSALAASGAIAGARTDAAPVCDLAPVLAKGVPPLVGEGQCWWMRSPDPGNPVACATCHHDPALVRPWATSFPKFRPLPPPHARVMTLLQANAEAVARHYRLADPRPAATAITAYLVWLGEGLPVTPGISAGQPVFTPRMRQLALGAARGRTLYAARCAGCHDVSRLAPAIGRFPRFDEGQGLSLESFVERHHPRGEPLLWDGQAMADLVAYLMSQRR